MLVIQMSTLTEFMAEVPAPTEVRLAQHYVSRNGSTPPTLCDLCLDLMARRGDEIVWLHEPLTVSVTGGMQFRDVPPASPELATLIRDYLAQQGYTVKPGRYGLPADIQPLSGRFECVRWDYTAEIFVAAPPEPGAPFSPAAGIRLVRDDSFDWRDKPPLSVYLNLYAGDKHLAHLRINHRQDSRRTCPYTQAVYVFWSGRKRQNMTLPQAVAALTEKGVAPTLLLKCALEMNWGEWMQQAGMEIPAEVSNE